MSLLCRNTPNSKALNDTSILALGLGMARQVERARQLERANEEYFGQLLRTPVIVAFDSIAPRLCDVSLVREPQDWTDAYQFEPPPLRGGTIRAFAIRRELPIADWEY